MIPAAETTAIEKDSFDRNSMVQGPVTVRYALEGSAQPLTVASYTAITAALEHDPKSALDA